MGRRLRRSDCRCPAASHRGRRAPPRRKVIRVRFTRTEVLERLQGQVRAGHPIVMLGAGIGLTARCAELGGADLIGIYSTAFYRMQGKPSLLAWLPYADANAETLRRRAGDPAGRPADTLHRRDRCPRHEPLHRPARRRVHPDRVLGRNERAVRGHVRTGLRRRARSRRHRVLAGGRPRSRSPTGRTSSRWPGSSLPTRRSG